MDDNMNYELPIRKSNRLHGYDYSCAGYYFITICTKDRKHLLSSVGANCVRPKLSDVGNVIDKEINVLSATYNNVTVDKYVIMPNHIHIILTITDCGRTEFAPTIPRIVKQFKGSITKHIGYPIWQKSYYDQIIRSQADYQNIWEYIDTNPAKWEEDEYYCN